MDHFDCSIAHIHWMENSGVQEMTFPCLKIVDATVTAEDGASKDVTMELSSLIVDEKTLTFDTAKMNELTGGDIAPGYVKTLHMKLTINVMEEVVVREGEFERAVVEFSKVQVTLDELQLAFDEEVVKFAEHTKEFEDNQIKLDEFQIVIDGLQAAFDKHTKEFEDNQIKLDEFQIVIDGLQAAFDKHTKEFEDSQIKLDEFQIFMDALLLRVDEIENKAINDLNIEVQTLKRKDFDQQVQIDGLLKVVFDLQREVERLKKEHNIGDSFIVA